MKKSRILVVEDEADIRELIALHLGREGHTVDACGSGNEAMRLAEENQYDLAVLDWMLPEKSGLEITRELRRSKQLFRTWAFSWSPPRAPTVIW